MSGDELAMIAGMSAVTFGIRYLLFAVADRLQLAPWLLGSLKFIPPAVLTAITVPAVVLPNGEWDFSPANPYLIAALVSLAAGVASRNLLVTITVGLLAFFTHRLLW
ncbi:MAG: AzlD domain-containing protein [Candidatus Accumulibacter sp.]|nr:AzlD domain-containing protein [Accumulibacter sp.]